MSWYVILKDTHLGPYTREFILDLYKLKKINLMTKIWSEGMERPKFLKDFIASGSKNIVKNKIKENPPSKKAETQRRGDQVKSKVQNKLSSSSDEFQSTHKKIRSIERRVDEVKKLDSKKLSEKKRQVNRAAKNTKLPLTYKFLFFSLCFLLLSILLIAIDARYNYAEKSFKRPEGMSVKKYRELLKVINKPLEKIEMALSVSRDKSKLWLVTNLPISATLEVKLTSLKDRTLQTKNISLRSSAALKNHLVELSTFTFEEGEKIYDGYYFGEIKNIEKVEISLFDRLFRDDINQKISLKRNFLISNMDESDFAKQLDFFRKSLKRNDDKFLDELIQKYSTIKAMALQIESALINILNNDSKEWGRKVKDFENLYLNQYGNYFTSFVIENEKAYETLKKKSFSNKEKVISQYTRLGKIAKNIGQVSVDSMNYLSSFSNTSQSSNPSEAPNSILKKIKMSFKVITDECDFKIKLINKLYSI